MSEELRLLEDADEHFDVVTAVGTFKCNGNGKATTSADLRWHRDCGHTIKEGDKYLLQFAQLEPKKDVRSRHCVLCARKFFGFALV